jgi:hypothetical protein
MSNASLRHIFLPFASIVSLFALPAHGADKPLIDLIGRAGAASAYVAHSEPTVFQPRLPDLIASGRAGVLSREARDLPLAQPAAAPRTADNVIGRR